MDMELQFILRVGVLIAVASFEGNCSTAGEVEDEVCRFACDAYTLPELRGKIPSCCR